MHSVWQLFGLCLCLSIARVWTSNPLEQLALGALSVGTQIMDTMQDGSKATKQINFDTPLMKVRSKTEMGHGNAMRPAFSDEDSDESEERRRRRRRRRKRSGSNWRHNEHLVAHRGKRSPCFNKMQTPTETPDDIEARRRRAAARKRAANNAARSRIIRNMNKKKTKKWHRLRRQAMQPDSVAQGQQGPSIGDRVKGFWLSFVDNVADVVQQMRQKIRGAANQAAQATTANIK